MTMRERIEAGKLFTDYCEGLPEDRIKAKKLMKQFNNTEPEDTAARTKLLNQIFNKESKVWIEPPFYFCYGYNIHLDNGCYINFNCNFIDDGKITIGSNTMLGAGVTIATVGHPIAPDMREYMYTSPVTIGNNCWIGANATICPGVTIGENSVIGAGSVVTKNIPANVIAAGNPCHVIREIGEQDKIFYFRDRIIDADDLAEERKLRGQTQ